MSRVLLKLRKGGEVKYLSHRDFVRAFELALRRARIPVGYSEGFNPRPRMSFGPAIGVGVTSEDERIMVELALDTPDIRERLNEYLPPGIEVLSAEPVPEGMKSPLSGLNASEFRITAECDAARVCEAVEKLLVSSEVRVTRVRDGKPREVDIRPYILEANVSEGKDGGAAIMVRLKSGDSGGAGPQDFIRALRNLVPGASVREIRRVRQFRIED